MQDHIDPARNLARPVLTMPAAEAERLRVAYEAATIILEYGSGGSTVMAAEMPGKTIMSVESDKQWAAMMRQWFTEHPPHADTDVDVFWADIGATVEWGFPQDYRNSPKFPAYALDIWQDPDMPQPEVVLVDGRFRVGCALATALYSRAPVSLFIDDYDDRPGYHVVEDWFGAPDMTGRLAHWTVTPRPLALEDLPRIIEHMLRPN